MTSIYFSINTSDIMTACKANFHGAVVLLCAVVMYTSTTYFTALCMYEFTIPLSFHA